MLGADPSLCYTWTPRYPPMYAEAYGYPSMVSGFQGGVFQGSHTGAMMQIGYIQQPAVGAGPSGYDDRPFGYSVGPSGYGVGPFGYDAVPSGSGVPPVTPAELPQEVDARLLLRAAIEEDVIFYDALKSSYGSCQSAVGGTSCETSTDAETPVLTVAQEVTLVDTHPEDATGLRGSNITLNVTDIETGRPLLTLTKNCVFEDGRASGVICNNLKKVMQKAHASFFDFSDNETFEAWTKFERTFRWDPRNTELIKKAYKNYAKTRWWSAAGNANEYWEAFKDPDIATRSSTWPTHEHMKQYVKYWAQDDVKQRAAIARENRLKKKGINHLCGSISSDVHRQRLSAHWIKYLSTSCGIGRIVSVKRTDNTNGPARGTAMYTCYTCKYLLNSEVLI